MMSDGVTKARMRRAETAQPRKFTMGCSEIEKVCEFEEQPPHEVTITKGFWLGQTEVT